MRSDSITVDTSSNVNYKQNHTPNFSSKKTNIYRSDTMPVEYKIEIKEDINSS